MNFRSSKFALLLGVINGVLFYLAYQPVKAAYVKYLWYIKNDEYVYIALPEIYRFARDSGELFVWTLLFALASYTGHHFWGTKLKSSVALWLRIAIIALAVPVIGLWILRFLLFLYILVLKQLDSCIPTPCSEQPLQYIVLILIREPIDIKFELLLFVTALIVNLIYGVVVARLSKRFAK
jgi:hypothetical protein